MRYNSTRRHNKHVAYIGGKSASGYGHNAHSSGPVVLARTPKRQRRSGRSSNDRVVYVSPKVTPARAVATAARTMTALTRRAKKAEENTSNGITYYKHVESHPLAKKFAQLKAISDPVIYYDIQTGTSIAATNRSNISEFSLFTPTFLLNRIAEAVTQAQLTSPVATNKDTQVCIKSLTVDYTFTNAHNHPVELVIYNALSKKDHSNTIGSLAGLEAANEGAPTAIVTQYEFDPFKFKMVKFYWKLWDKKRVVLNGGDTVKYQAAWHPNKMISWDDMNVQVGATNYLANVTPNLIYQVRGVSAVEATAGGTYGFSSARVICCGEVKVTTVPFPFPTKGVKHFETTLKPSLVGEKEINIAQQVASTGADA